MGSSGTATAAVAAIDQQIARLTEAKRILMAGAATQSSMIAGPRRTGAGGRKKTAATAAGTPANVTSLRRTAGMKPGSSRRRPRQKPRQKRTQPQAAQPAA